MEVLFTDIILQPCIIEGRSCQQTSYPNNCIEYNQFTYVSLPYIKNWYKAYDSCHRMGATLAVLNTRHKIDLLLDYMRSHPQLRYKDLLYVGLTNEKWVPVNSHMSKFCMNVSDLYFMFKVVMEVVIL